MAKAAVVARPRARSVGLLNGDQPRGGQSPRSNAPGFAVVHRYEVTDYTGSMRILLADVSARWMRSISRPPSTRKRRRSSS